MIVYRHNDCLLKDNGLNHPERKERIISILDSIKHIKDFKICFKDAPIADIETISLVHPKKYVHAIVKFKNGLTKMLIHDTNMIIPIFNSLYPNFQKTIKSDNLDFKIINNLNFNRVDIKKFPVIKILKILPKKNSLFETVIVSANDKLVHLFLEGKINFTDISKYLLRIINNKKFKKYKRITPRNIAQIEQLSNYVSLKISSLSV